MSLEVTTYGVPGSGGARASSFDIDGLRVLVSGGDDTDKVRGLADDLARAAIVAEALKSARERIALLERQLASAIARAPAAPARLFGTGYVRFTPDARMWVLGKRDTGWAAFGYRVDSWDELFRRWNVRVTEHGTDEHGDWWSIENAAVRA